MYLHTENEAASIMHSKLRTLLKKYENVSRSKIKVKMSKAPNYFKRYCSRYSDQAPAIFDQ